MIVVVHNHSSYPRVAKGDVAAIVAHQEAAGCDVVTDGLSGWADPFAPLLDGIEGVEGGDSLPYFGTEMRVRRPLVSGPLRHTRPLTVGWYTAAARLARKPVKVVLPGPYTLAHCADGSAGPYPTRSALGDAFAAVLAAEVAALAAAGATYIQIDEPAIISQPNDIRLLRAALEPLWAARGAARIVLSTWGPCSQPLYAQLNSVPADIIALDLVNNRDLDALITATGASKELALGLLDGKQRTSPSAETMARRVRPLLKRYDMETLHLGPAMGLRLRTAARAFDTLQQLAAVGNLVRKTV